MYATGQSAASLPQAAVLRYQCPSAGKADRSWAECLTFCFVGADLMRIIEAGGDDEMIPAAHRTAAIECSLLGDGLTCVSEIPVAEQREKKGEHENGRKGTWPPGNRNQNRGDSNPIAARKAGAARRERRHVSRALTMYVQLHTRDNSAARGEVLDVRGQAAQNAAIPARPAARSAAAKNQSDGLPSMSPAFPAAQARCIRPTRVIYSAVHRMPVYAWYHEIETLRSRV